MIKLDVIIEALEFDLPESNYFYSAVDDCVVMVSDEEFRYAENDTDLSRLREWQRENVEIAGKILDSDDFIPLPDKFELNEYGLMERFINGLEDEQVKDELWLAIEGRGAFRRFKDQVIYYGIDEKWYRFRDEAIKTFAKEWCESCNIKYEE